MVRGLPAGSYFVAVTKDSLSQAEFAAKLPALTPDAVRMTLGEGEKKVLDLRRKL